MYSLIIRQGKVVDGTGQPGAVMDVAVENDKVVNIAPHIPTRAATVIDASGKIVCPGFIDIQNHSDAYWQLFENPQLDSLIMQGYTSILVGQCGASLAPLISPGAVKPFLRWRDKVAGNVNWQTFREFVEVVQERSFGCNVGSLVGFDMVDNEEGRGFESGDPFEISMNLIKASLDAGAFGVSYRLANDLDPRAELKFKQLGDLVAEKNALLSVHIENEAGGLTNGVERCLGLAADSDVNLKISHLKVHGQDQRHQLNHVLELLETSRQRGRPIYFDVYPYDSTWQSLFSYLPDWIDKNDSKKLLDYLSNRIPDPRNLIIASTANQLNVAGKTLAEVAKNLGGSSEQALVEILRTGGAEILVFDCNLDARQVLELTFHPLGVIATDGGGFPLSATGPRNRLIHPRCFGTAPAYLRSALDHPHITLEEAIRKLTSLPARVMGLANRGELRVGNKADIVIFDPDVINGRATLQNPYQFPAGVESVLVAGQPVVFKGTITGARAGRFVLKR